MYIEREDDAVILRDLPVWVVDTLLCLPEWIESDNPAVRERLLPKAYLDDAEDQEWRDALGSSLEYLFASRTEIVRKDLHNLEISSGPSSDSDEAFVNKTLFRVLIPGPHISAWVSTLQAGTHALFILEGLTAEDVAQEVSTTDDPDKQVSMLRLSILQEILINLLGE
jgi:hypothetical protein